MAHSTDPMVYILRALREARKSPTGDPIAPHRQLGRIIVHLDQARHYLGTQRAYDRHQRAKDRAQRAAETRRRSAS